MSLVRENITPPKYYEHLIFGALFVLALGLLTSTSILALSHILMLVPCVYFAFHTNWKEMSKSAWALLGLSIAIMLSVAVNQDIMVKGWKPIFKVKYFLFGFFSIVPFHWWIKNKMTEKQLKVLLYTFLIATTVATIAGIIGLYTGTNPILMTVAHPSRNSGLFGMLMNYAHNLSYFLIIIAGLLLYREKVKKFINIKFLIVIFIINFVGFYLTYTRGAWLGFLMALPFFYFKNHKKIFGVATVALLLLGIGTYFVAGVKVIRPASDIQRFSQWQAAGMAFKERPILGYGYLNFENYSSIIKYRYDLPEKGFRAHAHNNFMEMLGSTGFLGTLAFVIWLITWGIDMYRRDDVIGSIGLPFVVVFIGGGLTQSTISLGINLFFVLAVFSVTQIDFKVLKESF